MGATDSFLSLIPETTESKTNKQMYGYAKTYDKFNPEEVSNLVIHHTGGDTPEGALAWWKNKESKGVGAHYIINKDGSIIETAPLTHSTGHIMPDLATKKINNRTSLGIEIVGKSDKDVNQAQKDAVKRLYEEQILPTYPNIKLENIRGHGELAKGYTGSHARPEDEGSSVVNFLRAKQANPEQSNGFLSRIPTNEIAPIAPVVETNQQTPTSYLQQIKNAGSNLVSPQYLAKDIAAKADLAYGVVPGAIDFVGTPFAKLADIGGSAVNAITGKPTINPNVGTNALSSLTSTMQNPIGKAFNITEDPAYKNEVATKIIHTIGEYAGKPISYIAEKTGLPEKDIAWFANAAGIKLAPTIGKAIGEVGTKIGEMREPKASVTIEGANYQPELNTQPVTKTVPKISADLTDAEFKQWINNPYDLGTKEITTYEPIVKQKEISVLPENPVLPAKPLNANELSSNEQLLKDVGVQNIRKSALEGNYKDASSQYITSKADNGPYAKGMAEQISHEKDSLNNHFQGVVTDTKGSVPRKGGENEISDRIDIGRNFKSAINDSYESVKTLRNQLYQNVRDTIGETPVNMNETTKLLSTESQFKVGDKKSLKEAIDTRMEELGMKDKDGTLQPSTVTQAEELRKFINDEVKNNPELYGVAKKIKDSIDNDMFSHVGGESFKVAREKHAELQELFENPDAIRNFRKDVGVNQKIADENVIQKLNTLPESQFTHILKVLKEQGQTSALSDIKANLVNQIKEAGQSEIGEPWNARAAAVQRTKLGNKLKEAFADDLQALEKIDQGIQAGNVLYIPTKYPGAAVQTQLLKNKFSEMALQKMGTVIGGGGGSVLGGPLGGALGAAGGEYLAGKGANALRSGRQTKQLEKEIKSGTPLNQIIKE
jgi:F0F1-type ATP synthase delta subunit